MSGKKLLGAALLSLLATATALFGGCRQVLSFEDRELSDAGADGATALDCNAYCTKIQEVCKGSNAQFASVDACLPFCSTYPVGKAGDTMVNSLACRVALLDTLAMPEDIECASAGPSGDDACGESCDAYCSAMLTICPMEFESLKDCQTSCGTTIDCGPYAIQEGTPNDPSVQCRIYHLSAAGVGFLDKEPGAVTMAQKTHCPHASGTTECIVQDPLVCP